MSSSHVHVVRPSPISVLPDPNNMLISSLNAIKEERERGKGEREGGIRDSVLYVVFRGSGAKKTMERCGEIDVWRMDRVG